MLYNSPIVYLSDLLSSIVDHLSSNMCVLTIKFALGFVTAKQKGNYHSKRDSNWGFNKVIFANYVDLRLGGV